MMPKLMPKSLINRCDFGTCDFLVFAMSVTFKSFFYIEQGSHKLSQIGQQSVRKRGWETWCKKYPEHMEHVSKNDGQHITEICKRGQRQAKGFAKRRPKSPGWRQRCVRETFGQPTSCQHPVPPRVVLGIVLLHFGRILKDCGIILRRCWKH